VSEDGAQPSPIRALALLPPEERRWILTKVTVAQRRELTWRWQAYAHGGQRPPDTDWRIWLIRAGRGFGKTRAGAEWISQYARDHPDARIALVGCTVHDVATVMIEGASGLIAVARRDEAVLYIRQRGLVRFASGATAYVYSANVPEGLRGPEHDAAWCDELAKWPKGQRGGEATWNNLLLGMRGCERPRIVVTTTPRPNALMRQVMKAAGVVETRGATRDNPHLPKTFVADMEAQFGGTRIGRQELDGEMIDDVAGAMWTRDAIEACRTDVVCEPVRVVIGVDPPASAGGDACGIIAAAIDGDGIVHVLEDASVCGASPEAWARAVSACADRHRADKVEWRPTRVATWCAACCGRPTR
jgi:phage terminase large subunit-like protein